MSLETQLGNTVPATEGDLAGFILPVMSSIVAANAARRGFKEALLSRHLQQQKISTKFSDQAEANLENKSGGSIHIVLST